jgi:hypothetical protein
MQEARRARRPEFGDKSDLLKVFVALGPLSRAVGSALLKERKLHRQCDHPLVLFTRLTGKLKAF